MTTPIDDDVFRDKCAGALLGTLVGDAIGAPLEGWEADQLNRMLDGLAFLTPAERSLSYAIYGVITGGDIAPGSARYTDDTEMMVGLTESLIAVGGVDGQDLATRFADNFNPGRGYGMGAQIVLSALRKGAPWDEPAAKLFGGLGSFGNGAAMRAAPLGIFYSGVSSEALRTASDEAARVTHKNQLGIDGAFMQAAAVAEAMRSSIEDEFDPFAFVGRIKASIPAGADEYMSSCDAILSLLRDQPDPVEVADVLGNGVEAHLSVPAALYAFVAHHDSFAQAVLFAIRLGGDTDTIGAMCGAIAGAFHGASAIPPNWLNAAENSFKGRDYIRELSEQLFLASRRA